MGCLLILGFDSMSRCCRLVIVIGLFALAVCIAQ